MSRPAGPGIRAVHTWSLFRTMGRYVAPGAMPSGDLPERDEVGLSLLDLPAELARHGYGSAQLCHFYLPRRDPAYLEELRAAFTAADVELECFLIDDGDLTAADGADDEAWVSSWLEVAELLHAVRARVIAGKQAPTPELLDLSARQLRRLAARHQTVRIVTENWHRLLPDADAVLGLLDRTEGDIGFLVDLGNWSGPTKYAALAAVAAAAETCQAKCRSDAAGDLDVDDYRRSLEVVRDGGYRGRLALVYDGADPAEWSRLDEEHAIVRDVFATVV